MSDDATKAMHEVEHMATNFIEAIRAHAQTAITAGIIMLICGFLAVAAPFIAGVSITIMVGFLLLVGGIVQCFLPSKPMPLVKPCWFFLLVY